MVVAAAAVGGVDVVVVDEYDDIVVVDPIRTLRVGVVQRC